MSATDIKDYFISYTGRDRTWAIWIEWIVREAGFTTVIQERDFTDNRSFLHDVQHGVRHCRKILAVFSPRYFESKWCTGELQAFYYKDPDGRIGLIFPVHIEDPGDVGLYADRPRAALAGLSKADARLQVRRLLGLEKHDFSREPTFPGDSEPAFPPAAPSGADWPEHSPLDLRWPIADHTEARESFARLITRNSPYRILTIRGGSDTGKSTLTQQMHRNVIRRLGLACGRFDFKGSGDVEGGLVPFAEDLQVPLPATGRGVGARLTAILESLRSGARPALLIFDTYEAAGESSRWMEETLLRGVHRSPWLRVVIAGQSVPAASAQFWEEDAAPLVQLQPPGVEDWFHFGREHKPDLTMADVEAVFRVVGGRGSFLAQALGPVA